MNKPSIKIAAWLFIALLCVGSAVAQKKTIILVRHAEKADAAMTQDPDSKTYYMLTSHSKRKDCRTITDKRSRLGRFTLEHHHHDNTLELANFGLRDALRADPALVPALQVHAGRVDGQALARGEALQVVPLDQGGGQAGGAAACWAGATRWTA